MAHSYTNCVDGEAVSDHPHVHAYARVHGDRSVKDTASSHREVIRGVLTRMFSPEGTLWKAGQLLTFDPPVPEHMKQLQPSEFKCV